MIGAANSVVDVSGFTLLQRTVPVGSRIRARAEVISVEDKGNGWVEVVTRFTIEREGEDKPVCVADNVGRALVA